jgi:glycosyltransferase involved in cell wall biosynthesis
MNASVYRGAVVEMLVIVHNILAPYRVPLFNELGRSLDGQLAVVLTRDTHRKRRRWSVPWQDVSFQVKMLHTMGVAHGERVFDISFGVHRTLDQLSPRMVVLGGWDLSASWSALSWCHRHAVPAVAWVESGAETGLFRGPFSSLVRRRFLDGCGGALVSGDAAAAFVNELRPGMPTTVVRNAVGLSALHALPAPTARSALFVGELSQRKGVDVLLDALPGLLQHLERVVIVGDGQLRPAVLEATQRLDRVHYLGYLEGPSLVDAFASADVIVAPSRKDPAPLVASEALAAGRPLVLGPGVGNATDLRRLAPNAVNVMVTLSASELIGSVRNVLGHTVPAAARAAFAPSACAETFLKGTEAFSCKATDPEERLQKTHSQDE